MTIAAPYATAHNVPEHAAEAVIKRHRDADAVGGGVTEASPAVIDIEQQIAMAERGRFGEASRAGSVLDVNRIAAIELRGEFVHARGGNQFRPQRGMRSNS